MPARSASHLPILDGLRAVAVLLVLLVLLAHVDPDADSVLRPLTGIRLLVDPGILGVDLFFVLSGFLITRILVAERERGLPVRWFLLRRMLRIFPVYYLLLAIVWVARGGPELPWCIAYLSNVHFILHGGGSWLEHTWSLCIEEHFYLLWPPIVAFAGPRIARRALLLGAFPIAIATAWWVVTTVEPERLYRALHYASPIRFLSLGTGCLMAFAEDRLRPGSSSGTVAGVALLAAGLLAAPQVLGFAFVQMPARFGASPWLDPALGPYWPLAALPSVLLMSAGAMSCCLCAGRRSPLQLLAASPLRAIGRVSYGLYLYHLPIFRLMHDRPVLAIGVSLAAATASYWLVERPILRFAARFR